MKKIAVVLLIALFLLVLVSCDNDKHSDRVPADTGSKPEQTMYVPVTTEVVVTVTDDSGAVVTDASGEPVTTEVTVIVTEEGGTPVTQKFAVEDVAPGDDFGELILLN